MHIHCVNCLELLVAILALQTFTKERRNITVLLDNTTAVSYIGGTVSKELLKLARALWMWCLERNIHLIAQHLPGHSGRPGESLNGRQVRLETRIFKKFNYQFGPLEVDLLASRLSAQLQTLFSWRPDPLALAIDAFLQDWGRERGLPTHQGV